VFGVQFNSVAPGQFANISNWLVTSTNPQWAIGITYVSIALIAIMGAIAAAYVLITGGRAEVPEATATK